MKILDILNSPWAIAPQALKDIQNTYLHHLQREKIDFSALVGSKDKTEPLYQQKNGVAIIPIRGVLTPGNSFFSYFFGGSSYKNIQSAIQQADNDPQIKQIILDIDSPGGTVKGAFETADVIRAVTKPVFTWSEGQITSAALMIAAPTEKIMITGKTNPVGSIGVIATHVDYSKSDEAYGVKITEVVSGKYKNITSDTKPLSKEGRESLQEDVDYLFSLFANDVASDMGIDVETIVDWQAKVFIGQQAIEAGLVDGVSTLAAFVDQLSNPQQHNPINVDGVSTETKTQKIEVIKMEITFESILADHPEVYQAIFEAGKKSGEEIGTQKERDRILAIHDAALPGHEELVKTCVNEGLSAGDAAMRMLTAEKQHLKNTAQAIQDEAPAPVEVDNPAEPTAVDQKPKPEEQNLPLDQQAKADWEKTPELRTEFLDDFDSYLAYLRAEASGQARILKK